MMHTQQQMQKIVRALLPVRKSLLTASECELLAHLYLYPEQNTPVLLSQESGMKKEAVSRCLKSLYEKNCIRKERQTADERSYRLFMTETGLAELKDVYKRQVPHCAKQDTARGADRKASPYSSGGAAAKNR